ncbi:hypothetical protein D1007_28404 [Hordeum vulgare]|nr:hypothetical protein D1007_28404 [Hordeum vulgare]
MEVARVVLGAAEVVVGSGLEEVAVVAEAEAAVTWCGCANPRRADKISSNVDPRHGGSDKSRWEAAAMEMQGGTRGEKWGDNSTQVAAGGSAGGRLQETRPQQHPADRRHPTPGKRNASPLVGSAEVCVTCRDPGHLPAYCPRAVCEGHASGRQLEEFFNSYINTNWRCSARSIGPNTFVMRFPSPRDVDKACFAESMNVKSCGVVINLRKWSESVGAKGVLNIAWVNVSNIPLDKRHEKNIAYVGSLVGVTLEIDKATINRPESVRIKLGCRDAEDIPASAEGVLGGHFYDLFYSVDKILIQNPPKEKIGIQNENEEEEKDHNESEDMLSEEESDEMGNELLIDTMVKEAEKNQRDDEGGDEKGNVDSGRVFYDEITVNSLQIVPSSISFPSKKFLSYLDACVGEPVVTEMDPTVIYDDQKNQSYLV